MYQRQEVNQELDPGMLQRITEGLEGRLPASGIVTRGMAFGCLFGQNMASFLVSQDNWVDLSLEVLNETILHNYT
jgi:hypothetical protein